MLFAEKSANGSQIARCPEENLCLPENIPSHTCSITAIYNFRDDSNCNIPEHRNTVKQRHIQLRKKKL